MNIEIRPATTADLPGILSIYNDAVRHSLALWNETPVDLANRQAWLHEQQQQGFAVLVATNHSDVLGYASYGKWRAQEGFRHCVENSLYIAPAYQGQGLGKRLLSALINHAQQAGKRDMIAAIESSNQTSIRLHQNHGFRIVGQLPEIGEKFSQRLDLTLLQLKL